MFKFACGVYAPIIFTLVFFYIMSLFNPLYYLYSVCTLYACIRGHVCVPPFPFLWLWESMFELHVFDYTLLQMTFLLLNALLLCSNLFVDILLWIHIIDMLVTSCIIIVIYNLWWMGSLRVNRSRISFNLTTRVYQIECFC